MYILIIVCSFTFSDDRLENNATKESKKNVSDSLARLVSFLNKHPRNASDAPTLFKIPEDILNCDVIKDIFENANIEPQPMSENSESNLLRRYLLPSEIKCTNKLHDFKIK